MSVHIREYQESDRSALVLLMEELQDHLVAADTLHLRRRHPDYGESYTTRLLKIIAGNHGIIFMAEAEGEIVGCIAGTIEKRTKEDLLEWIDIKTGRIQELHINEKFRSLGIGTSLMEQMESYFRAHECDVSRTEVLSDNARAHAFYERLGYEDRYVDVIKRL